MTFIRIHHAASKSRHLPDDLKERAALIQQEAKGGHQVPGDGLIEGLGRGLGQPEHPGAGQTTQLPPQLQVLVLT